MSQAGQAPILLIGAQRSGTTALAYALSEAFGEVDGLFTVNGKLMYFLHRWLTEEDLYHRHLRVDEILYSLKRKAPDGVGVERWLERVEQVLRTAAEEVADGKHDDALALGRKLVEESYQGVSRWGDKYNEYLHHLSHLHELVPDARYLLLFRTPYETAASVMEWKGDRPWRPTTLEGNLEKWAAWHAEVLAMFDTLPADRRLVMEYHRLCAGEETERLSDFLQLDMKRHLAGMKPRRQPMENPPLPSQAEAVWTRLQAFSKQ